MMHHITAKRQSRREMFRSTLRYLALGGISLASARLISRGAASRAEGGCRRSASCVNCAAIGRCKLPRALAAKKRNER